MDRAPFYTSAKSATRSTPPVRRRVTFDESTSFRTPNRSLSRNRGRSPHRATPVPIPILTRRARAPSPTESDHWSDFYDRESSSSVPPRTRVLSPIVQDDDWNVAGGSSPSNRVQYRDAKKMYEENRAEREKKQFEAARFKAKYEKLEFYKVEHQLAIPFRSNETYSANKKIATYAPGPDWKIVDRLIPCIITVIPYDLQMHHTVVDIWQQHNIPNLMRYEIVHDGGYLILEEPTGYETLAAKIHRDGKFDEKTAVRIIDAILQALQGIHRSRYIHTDVNAYSIFIPKDYNKKAKAKVLLGNYHRAEFFGHGLWRESERIGPHMAPEQIARYKDIKDLLIDEDSPQDWDYLIRGIRDGYGFKADVWAVGMLVYEMLKGRNPFEGLSDQEMAKAILTEWTAMQSLHPIPEASDKMQDFLFRHVLVHSRDRKPAGYTLLDHPVFFE